MTFNSLSFLVFFAVFYPAYLLVRRREGLRLLTILVASVVFYGWWDWRFLLLIFFTGGVDFAVAQLMTRFPLESRARKACVAVSLLSGLGTLGIFKYSAFFADALSALLSVMGINVDLHAHIPPFCLILPVGISFYTFQSLSYTIDVYRGSLRPTKNPVHFFAYLMLFPQLVAGPIVRATDLLWQLRQSPRITSDGQWSGLRLCVIGLVKKCLIADNLAHYVDLAFANVLLERHSSYWWVVMLGFAVQIYCDFSGYSDIARGLIETMGYRFGLNFNHPYLATGAKDFWRRWHISLSSWFRDYLYIPLGGGRRSAGRTIFNLWVVFVLSGLWHGAGWHFVAWGALHALWLSIERLFPYRERFVQRWRAALPVCWLITQVQVVSAWVFFRADSFTEAWHILGRMFSFRDVSYGPVQIWPFLILFLGIELWGACDVTARLRTRFKGYAWLEALGLAALAAAAFWMRGEGHAFIYFQF